MTVWSNIVGWTMIEYIFIVLNLKLSFLNSISMLVREKLFTLESNFVAVEVWLGGIVDEEVDLLSISNAAIDR